MSTGKPVKKIERIFDSNYFIDSEGNIFNKKGIMKPQISKTGYRMIGLWIEGKKNCYKLSRLVAKAFIPNIENKPCVNHKNGIKTDDRLENLEWVTISENAIHAYQTGLNSGTRGEKNGQAKLNWEQIIWIRKNYIPRDKKFGLKSLRKKFNIGQKTIQRIVNYESWK